MQIEDLKLLSTAERYGALSLLESALETEPGTIASFSIPPLVSSIGMRTAFKVYNEDIATAYMHRVQLC